MTQEYTYVTRISTPSRTCAASQYDYSGQVLDIKTVTTDTKLEGIKSRVKSCKIHFWFESSALFKLWFKIVRGTWSADASHAAGLTQEAQLNACISTMWTAKTIAVKASTWKAANVHRQEFVLDITPYARKAIEENLAQTLKGVTPLGLSLVLQSTSPTAAATISGAAIVETVYDLVPIANKPI